MCLLFSSCSKKQVSSIGSAKIIENEDSNKDTHNVHILNFIEQQETMLVDIPLPLYDERIIPTMIDATKTDTMVFGYKSPLTRAECTDFFMNQMERYGWRQLVFFDSFEALLEFESPNRYCTILIREDENNGSSLFIFIKRASSNARSESVGVE